MKRYVISKNKIRNLMKNKNISTQTELAKEMNITKNELSRILSPDYDYLKSNIRNLCDILNCSIEDIIVDPKRVKKKKDNKDEFLYKEVSNVKPLKEYNVVELFAGAGGLALGLEKAGFKTKGLVEIDKYCIETLKNNRPSWNIIHKDIVKVSNEGIKKHLDNDIEIDLLSGGYPCQAFSYAGHKLGLKDVRGTLFYNYAQILKELKPKMFLAENVKGLVSHDKGRTLKTMINVFDEIGYGVTYKVLSATDYDVAQKRNRIIIIGLRKDLIDNFNVEYFYPKPQDYKPTLRDALKDVPDSLGAKYPEKKNKVLNLVPPGGCWRDLPDDIAKDYMGKSYYSTGGRTGMARRLSWDEQCLTLTCSPAQKQTERCHPDEVRPFTVREYARIQSFPDDWEFAGSLSQQYKQIGNAVPVNMAKYIGLSIINTLNEIEKRSNSL